MWRGATAARSLRFCLLSNPNHSLAAILSLSPPLAGGIFTSRIPTILSSASFSHSATGSWTQVSRDVMDAPTVAAASSSPVAAVALGSKASSVAEAIRHYGRCYYELSKARLSMLVVATSGAGYVLGSCSMIDIAGLCCTCTGTMMVAASANTLNQVFEVENDAKMKRTMLRPLPSGRIGASHAAVWASSIGIAGTALLAWKANSLAAGLAACNLVLYAFVYTPLKQIHPVNTWVGAVVGAIPPLLGWAAASSELSLNAVILPAALFYWQIPHFMALVYLCRNDYVAGGYRMFSLADPSGQRTAWVSFRNCLYMFPLGFFAYNWGLTSQWFTLESSLLTLALSVACLSFVRDRTSKNARRMFHASLLYLPVFMSGLLLHRLPNEQAQHNMTETNRIDRVLHDGQLHGDEESRKRKHQDQNPPSCGQARPPVAYASVAPFPFLPAPLYIPPDS